MLANMIALFLVGAVTAPGGQRKNKLSNAEAIAGTWVLQQVSNMQELERLLPKAIAPALSTPYVRGFCLRVPWKSIDKDFSLLEAGLRIAREHRLAYSVRFMAGRHTPQRVFDKGCRFYSITGRRPSASGSSEKIPAPFLQDGSPNTVFENEYERFVNKLARWCRRNDVRLLHLAWYGRHWAELNHGKEVRALQGYTFENWLNAHIRLLDIGLKCAAEDLAVELPFSGYGPLTEAASLFADHVVRKIGPSNQSFFCQANGWGPRGDWGAPNANTETAFDRVWTKPICRGQQAIQPHDFDWAPMYEKLYRNRATYCEVYTPSFLREHKRELAAQIRRFAEHSHSQGPLLPNPELNP